MATKLWSSAQKGTYSGATAYVIGDFVTYNGSSYTCIANTTGNLPTNTTYWALIASKGDTGATGSTGSTGATGASGADGLDVTWRGAYSGVTAYVVNDAVSYNGSSYICILSSTGNLPTNATYWDLMASKGDTGAGTGDMLKATYDTDNDGIVDNSEALGGQAGSYYLSRTNHTGTQSADTLTDGTTNKTVTAAEKATWSGKQDALGYTPENSANKAIAGGYASLDGTGKVPSAQLPSFVDDVIEAANFAALPGTGETGKIYVTLDDNKTYRWSGSAYVEISASPGSTDSVTEGSTNLYFTAARAIASALTGFSVAGSRTAVVATDTILAAFGKVQKYLNDLGSLAFLSTVATAQIDNDAVTYAKIQNVSATDKLLGRSTAGAGDVEEITCTAAGRALLDDADATAQRTTLGLGTAATMTGPAGTIVGTSDTQTLTNKTISGASNTISNVANSSLTNSAITIAGTSTALGGSISQDTITGLASTGLVKRSATNTLAIATAGTDYIAPGAGNADSSVTDASDTTKGKVELATIAETNTGTDATRAVTPDGLAGSEHGKRYIAVTLNSSTALATTDKAYFRIPAALSGMNLISVAATLGTGAAGASSSGTPTFTIKNVTDNNQMLSTSLTVDVNEYTSATAATAAVINTSFDDVATDDLIEIACTVAGTGVTYATITLGFQLP